MSRPVIGIAANFYDRVAGKAQAHARLNAGYFEGVHRAGGLPVILPPVEDPATIAQFLGRVDGLLFGGGYDIDPRRFGQDRHPKTELLAGRLEPFLFELFAQADRRAELPALGICLGCQLFAVARGGTLHQHLPDVKRTAPVAHFAAESQYTGGREHHLVHVTAGSRLAEALAGLAELPTNSGHHQAVDQPGRGLAVSARCTDGVVEAVEDPSRRLFLAVQWHPEELLDRPEQLGLFRALVAAAGRK